MKEYFNVKEPIDKATILRYFIEHEEVRIKRNNGISDGYAKKIIGILEADDRLRYWKCSSTIQTIEKLRLPYHIHDNKGDSSGIELVGKNGVLLNDFYRCYEKHKNNALKSECINKINKLKEVFFAKPTDYYYANFILLSNDGNKVHEDNYIGSFKNELFIANGFHRLAAYGLTLQGFGQFIPIEIYYANNPNIVDKYIEMK